MRFKEKIGRQISEQLKGSDKKITKYLEKENVFRFFSERRYIHIYTEGNSDVLIPQYEIYQLVFDSGHEYSTYLRSQLFIEYEDEYLPFLLSH